MKWVKLRRLRQEHPEEVIIEPVSQMSSILLSEITNLGASSFRTRGTLGFQPTQAILHTLTLSQCFSHVLTEGGEAGLSWKYESKSRRTITRQRQISPRTATNYSRNGGRRVAEWSYNSRRGGAI